jgi:putative membrane protein
MPWIKSLHIVFMVAWFAGLFYLPRLFVYHAQAEDAISLERFQLMERRLYRGIMTPSMLVTLACGLWLWLGFGITGGWLHAKLACVAFLVAHHAWLGKLIRDIAADPKGHSPVFYRWINEIPALPLLVAIVILVVVKPF